MNRMPSLFIIGAMKAGTTALAHVLGEHSQIFMCDPKEPQYFIEETHFGDKPYTHDEYMSFFSNASENQICAESSTWYLYDPKSAKLIHQFNPRARIIAILRHPIDRAFSHWQYLHRDGRCPHPNFEIALKEEQALLSAGNDIHRYPYLAMGKYAKRLQPFFDIFPKKYIKIFIYDELKESPQKILCEIEDWLELPHEDLSISKGVNSSGIPKSRVLHQVLHSNNLLRKAIKPLLPSANLRKAIIHSLNKKNIQRTHLNPSLRKRLTLEIEEDLQSLEKLTHLDLNRWRSTS